MFSRGLRRAAAAVLFQALSSVSYAQGQPLRQMDHSTWTARDGAPQVISELAQDRDGTLWVGSDSGLFNFDGQTFRPFTSPPGQPALPAGRVSSLLVTKDGTLWVGISQAGVARFSRGQLGFFSKAESEDLLLVEDLREAPDGTIWAVANRNLLVRFGSDGEWRKDPTPSSNSIGGIFVDSSSTLWLAQDGSLYRRPLTGISYRRTDAPADAVYGFAEASNGDIWVTDINTAVNGGRIHQIDRTGDRVRVFPRTLFMGALVFAADGSLIAGSLDAGIRRYSAAELSAPWTETLLPNGLPSTAGADVFTRENGLSSNASRIVMLDAHGNIWAGGARGLDRLRPARLTAYRQPADGSLWVVCASKRGDIWIGGNHGLFATFLAEPSWVPGVGNLYSLACADDGRAWYVDHKGMWSVVHRTASPLPPIAGAGPYAVKRLLLTSDQTLYATVLGSPANGGGIWRLKDAHWTRVPGELGVGWSAYVDREDRLWIGHTGGRATRHTDAGWQEFSAVGERGLGFISAFLDTARGLFAAGDGIAVLRGSRFETLTFAEPTFVRGVRGVVESGSGDIWLNTATGFVQLTAKELEAGLADTTYAMKARRVREGDFAGAFQSSLNSLMDTAARDSKGRLWFATRSGVVHLDPDNVGVASRPPIVTIRSVTADGQPLNNRQVLEAATRTLAVQYFGANLSAPENVVYRYRLENYDESWHEAGRRTEAIYTRVPPGTYTFSVMASNGDGTWTEPVSSEPFTVLPRFYETWWFAATVVGLAALVIAVAYRIRVQQIARVLNARFDERLAERTRVARELHDTLLQTVHGSKMVADRALRDAREPDRLVRALEQLSTWLGQAAEEGRAALHSLRSVPATPDNLASAFRRAIDECSYNAVIAMTLTVRGDARELPGPIHDEIYRIGYEAIRNACVHAGASKIDVDVEYDDNLTLRVSDDGSGIEAAIIEHGKDGHFGLRGMRERAERIGGRLTISSELGTGTVITLAVPGRVAFRSA